MEKGNIKTALTGLSKARKSFLTEFLAKSGFGGRSKNGTNMIGEYVIMNIGKRIGEIKTPKILRPIKFPIIPSAIIS